MWATGACAVPAVTSTAQPAMSEATASPPSFLGLTPLEVVLLGAPPVLYGLFSLYRSQINDKAKVLPLSGPCVHRNSIACSKSTSNIGWRWVWEHASSMLPILQASVQCNAHGDCHCRVLLQLVDFVSVLAAVAIFGNIFSILFWKVRLIT